LSEENFDKYDKVRQLLEERTSLKPSSLDTYMSGLRTICKYANVDNPFELIEKGLEWIEDITEEWIRAYEHELSPKHLNVVYCSVKTWCKATRLIESRRMFREVDFDKTSRKTEALTETALTTQKMYQGFQTVKISDKIDIGLYGLCGLRPTLIPQLKIIADKHRCGFHKRSAHIENGKLVIDRKPALYIITRLDESGKPRRGNKGNISFPIFIPSRLCELIETFVNSRYEEIKPDSKLSESHNDDAVYWKVKEFYRKIGFKGRPYLLRSYADRILDRITREFNEEDLKEFLMGHKGKLSAIYQFKAISEEEERDYRKMYVEACDSWINEHIFGMATKETISRAEMLVKFATQLGVSESETTTLLEAFKNAKIDMKQFEAKLTELTNKALEQKMVSEFERLYLQMEAKHNH
jgi:hypothetical protein